MDTVKKRMAKYKSKFSSMDKRILAIILLISSFTFAQTTVTLEDQCNCEVLQGTDVSVPGVTAPSGADLGDLYVNTNSGTIFFWDGNSWELTATDNQQLAGFIFDDATNQLTLDLEDGGSVNVDLSSLRDTFSDANTVITSFDIDAGTNSLIITDSEANSFSISLASLASIIDTDDQDLQNFQINGANLEISIQDGNTVSIPLADISARVDTNTTNASITEDGTNLILTDSEGATVTIPLADIAGAVNTDNQTLAEVLTEGNSAGTSIADVTDPTNAQDAATKNYVDGQITAFTGNGNITSGGITVGGDTNSLLGDVTLEIASGAVGTAELADDAVTPLKIASSLAGTGLARSAAGVLSVDGSAIAGDGNITSGDLTVGGDTDALLGDVTLEITAGAVGTSELADTAVATGKLADNAVTSAKIIDDAVTPLKIAASLAGTGISRSVAGVLSVDGTAITGDGNITSSDLTVGGDTNSLLGNVTLEIAAGAVGTTELADNAVTTAKIADGTIATADLANNSVTSANIVDATIVSVDLADNSVISAKIVDGTIVTADIANDAVSLAKLANGTSSGQIMRWNGSDWILVQESANEVSTTAIDTDGDGTNETNLQQVVNAIAPITSKAARVFYPPSIAIDASVTGTFTINLYSQYIAQFGSPVVSSGGTIPTYLASELDYHVTFADAAVFNLGTMSISTSGVLTYTVTAPPADYNSLINVVFVVR